ncbi:uncharacterized protein B0T23DRAFT_121741 [Neurospora hispaniola]|uniref:Zn(2)-C6 fungal-type domain-containing protein n=1 Tax=Neurospora hispaniola TaxID=588809 RepID=A0AAJ0MT23_9PEZI|nr:hypothetical protein B0T23DRAFT_121741 [Neurospora hispaniola]
MALPRKADSATPPVTSADTVTVAGAGTVGRHASPKPVPRDRSSPPAPPPPPSAGSTPPRIRRNTACIKCRDSKVRCNASLSPGQPCLRCTKLDLECIVDKNYKRASKKSKLEELAAELQSLKNTVAPRPSLGGLTTELPPIRPVQFSSASPPVPSLPQLTLPGTLSGTLPGGLPTPGTLPGPFLPGLGVPTLPPPIFTRPRPFSISSEASTPTPRASDATSVSFSLAGLRRPAQPRALGSRVFSGDDINYYFDKYFEHFHPYFPVVRQRDPDICYERGHVLFWAIIMTACRRFAKDDSVYQFLMDSLLPEIWNAISRPPLKLPIINALLLVATWPNPDIRFLTDPSMIFTGIAMNSALLIGLHTGRGAHTEFTGLLDKVDTTDEEATYTWAGCAIISHRAAAYMGCPSPSLLFNQTVDSLLDRSSSISMPRYFILHLETARFANKLISTMSASLEQSQGVSHRLVAQMEEEYSKIQCLLYPDNSDLDNFILLSTLLEIQTYYFMPLPGYSEEMLKRNVIKCYTTAEAIINQARSLQSQSAFLHYSPNFVFRTLLSAICVFMTLNLSQPPSPYTKNPSNALDASYMGDTANTNNNSTANSTTNTNNSNSSGNNIKNTANNKTTTTSTTSNDTADLFVREALRILRCCSVQRDDLVMRASNMVEKYWNMRHTLPRYETLLDPTDPDTNSPQHPHNQQDGMRGATTVFRNRLGSSLTFGCLRRWKQHVEKAWASVGGMGMNPPGHGQGSHQGQQGGQGLGHSQQGHQQGGQGQQGQHGAGVYGDSGGYGQSQGGGGQYTGAVAGGIRQGDQQGMNGQEVQSMPEDGGGEGIHGRLGNNNPQESSLGGLADPFQRLEWNAFMDDFDWSFTSNYLGVGPI